MPSPGTTIRCSIICSSSDLKSRPSMHWTAAPSHIIATIMSHAGKVALITGITGQDGSYLTEFLLSKGYTVSPDNPPNHAVSFGSERHTEGTESKGSRGGEGGGSQLVKVVDIKNDVSHYVGWTSFS